jgi:hypothetical protein
MTQRMLHEVSGDCLQLPTFAEDGHKPPWKVSRRRMHACGQVLDTHSGGSAIMARWRTVSDISPDGPHLPLPSPSLKEEIDGPPDTASW